MQLAVALVIRVAVRDQVLVAEVLEDLLEKLVEPADILGKERASAADRREPFQHGLQLVRADSSPLADHVDRRVAALSARDGGFERGVARLVVAVAEEQHRRAGRGGGSGR